MEMLTGYWKVALDTHIWGNSVAGYIQAIATFIAISFLLALARKLIISRLERIAKRTSTDIDDFIAALLTNVPGWVYFFIATYTALQQLNLPAQLKAFFHFTLIIVITISVIRILERTLQFGLRKIYRRRLKKDDTAIDLMVKNTSTIMQWVLWVLGALFIMDNVGINITTLAAGIGIGGIAVAIASQAVLGDAFSAISIFLDKPFELGDFIIVDNFMGTVEHIGIKTTRVRSLDGELLVFANTDLTKSRIKNYKLMAQRRVAFKVNIDYMTPIEQVAKVPGMIRAIIENIDKVRLDRVHFQSFTDFALAFEIVYYVSDPDYNLYMDIQQRINLEIMRTFEAEDILFAQPTHVVKLQDSRQKAQED